MLSSVALIPDLNHVRSFFDCVIYFTNTGEQVPILVGFDSEYLESCPSFP